MKRYLALEGPTTREPGPYEVFLSVGGEDVDVADRVHRYLDREGISTYYHRVPHANAYFLQVVDEALDSANCLIVIGSKPENLWRPFVEYEWRSFFYDTLIHPEQNAKMLSYIAKEFHHGRLPRPLRLYRHVKYSTIDPDSGLPDLLRELRAPPIADPRAAYFM